MHDDDVDGNNDGDIRASLSNTFLNIRNLQILPGKKITRGSQNKIKENILYNTSDRESGFSGVEEGMERKGSKKRAKVFSIAFSPSKHNWQRGKRVRKKYI